MTTPDVVLIGIGTEAAGDDAIGIEVVRSFAPCSSPFGIVETDGEPTRLIDAWRTSELAIVVDAARSDVGDPIVLLDGLHDPLPADDRRSSHGLGLGEAIALGRQLDQLPERLVVVAVRGEWFGPGFGLSEVATRHVAEAVALVAELAAVGPASAPVPPAGPASVGLDGRDRDVDEPSQPAGEIESEPA